jgi:hypothetical protein
MDTISTDIKVKGKVINVPFTLIEDKIVIITGKWIKIASILDEDWLPGQVIASPELFITKLKEYGVKADVFTFAQKIPDVKQRYKYSMKWENAAAIPLTNYEDWWQRVSTDLRKDLKRAMQRGVVVKALEFNDELVEAIRDIQNDTVFIQGIYNKNYGQDFETVKKGYSTYLERSEFIGAYYENELIGLIKMVYVGELARMMQILSKPKHNDKRPINALISLAVDLSIKKGKSYLTYGNYYYGNKRKSSLVDFKHRNGFERILFPRYYIPMSFKGKIAIIFRFHYGILEMLPSFMISFIVKLRSIVYKNFDKLGKSKTM